MHWTGSQSSFLTLLKSSSATYPPCTDSVWYKHHTIFSKPLLFLGQFFNSVNWEQILAAGASMYLCMPARTSPIAHELSVSRWTMYCDQQCDWEESNPALLETEKNHQSWHFHLAQQMLPQLLSLFLFSRGTATLRQQALNPASQAETLWGNKTFLPHLWNQGNLLSLHWMLLWCLQTKNTYYKHRRLIKGGLWRKKVQRDETLNYRTCWHQKHHWMQALWN